MTDARSLMLFLSFISTVLLAFLLSVVFSPLQAMQGVMKPDIAKGEALYTHGDATRGITACVSCHGPAGASSIVQNAKLGGQHAAYTAKQLREFKSGQRKDPVMSAMVMQMTEDEMKDIAAYLSHQLAKPGAAKNKETLELGQKIYRSGVFAAGVMACAACHSANGAGIPNQFPRLGGQHAEYTAAQMRKFRDGSRANAPMMQVIAHRMTDKEIDAVADYIAGLSSPSSAGQ